MVDKLSPSEASRLVDYVNDKIQTTADLQSLGAIIKTLEEQQDLQRRQLREAEEILENATKASIQHSETVRRETEARNQTQADLNQRLITVTRSESSEEATAKLEANLEKLERLDLAKEYSGLLRKFDGLSKDVLEAMDTSPPDALQAFTQLRSVFTTMLSDQKTSNVAVPQFLSYAESMIQKLQEVMRESYSDKFQAVLEKMKWPAKEQPDEKLVNEWVFWCELLLQLQEHDLIISPDDEKRGDETPILLPLEAMVHPLELRFRYHFSGDRPTNRLDKPEYFLSHVLDLISTHSDFFVTHLQPILDRVFLARNEKFPSLCFDATSCYISALLPMLRQKVTGILPQVSKHPQGLSHLMHELISFDNEIRDVWGFTPNLGGGKGWKGLTWEVLVQENWFNQWLQVEKNFALSRYQNIIDAEDGGEIDYDGVSPAATKPTKAAIRVNDLLETVTDLYRPLLSFSQKIRFLIDIQITIFDLFHERLHSGLEAYLAMTSTIGRTVQSSTSRSGKSSLEGTAGLERLCRIFGSAEYLEKKMQDWSDDVFFLELWYELQEHVAQNSRTGRPVAGPMSVAEIAARTSSSVANSKEDDHGEKVEGALFDETSAAYQRLRLRSESIILSALVASAQSSLRPYSHISTWTSLSSTSDSKHPAAPSLDLAPALRTISTELTFISRVLAVAPRRRITHKLLLAVQTYLWDNILMRNTFSTPGAAQLKLDVENVCSTVDVAIGATGNESISINTIQKLNDALTLLNLRITTNEPNESSSAPSELGLWEVEKQLFADNVSARNVLMLLGIETLTEQEARSVIERRVEVRS